jgi:hypothetical protein
LILPGALILYITTGEPAAKAHNGAGIRTSAYAKLYDALSEFKAEKGPRYDRSDFLVNWPLRADMAKESQIVVSTSYPPTQGVRVHRSELLVQLKPEVPPDRIPEFTKLLEKKYQLRVTDSLPAIGVLVANLDGDVLRPADSIPPSLTNLIPPQERENSRRVFALDGVAAKLREDPLVRAVTSNSLIGVTILPKPSTGKGEGRFGKLYWWDWTTGPDSPAAADLDGNWGLKKVGFPAAWNFLDAAKRRSEGKASSPTIGVLDVGFADHEDLVMEISKITSPRSADHGNHVAGIIGASWNVPTGINGCLPSARLIGAVMQVMPLGQGAGPPKVSLHMKYVIANLIAFIEEHPEVRVINLSLGYNWVREEGVNPNKDQTVQKRVRDDGTIIRTVAELAAEKGIILVCAAGNDSELAHEGVEAQWASPFNWAALNKGFAPAPAQNVIVVESIGRKGRISRFSNVHGCLSAPGEGILSAVASPKDSYEALDGTSMAAPHVTGLIGLMYTYNPNLKYTDVLDILGVLNKNRPSANIPAPTINAFDALVGCRPNSLNDLADLNGDGKVDMKDFKIFKAALAQVEGRSKEKSDLNGDGKINEYENVFPRADLNGSGKLSRDPADKRTVRGKPMSDLDVMKAVWGDPDVASAALDGLLN